MTKKEFILSSVSSSSKSITAEPVDESNAEKIIATYGINPESYLGTFINLYGSLTINGIIRIYGSGKINLLERNEQYNLSALAVGEDIFGGLFLFLENGSMGYFAPDCLEVEDMEISYGQFLAWCMDSDTGLFYIACLYDGWQDDAAKLTSNQGISFYPPLWAKADGTQPRSRKAVPMHEIVAMNIEMHRKLNTE